MSLCCCLMSDLVDRFAEFNKVRMSLLAMYRIYIFWSSSKFRILQYIACFVIFAKMREIQVLVSTFITSIFSSPQFSIHPIVPILITGNWHTIYKSRKYKQNKGICAIKTHKDCFLRSCAFVKKCRTKLLKSRTVQLWILIVVTRASIVMCGYKTDFVPNLALALQFNPSELKDILLLHRDVLVL